jgi:hypothetical protein
MSSEAFAPVLVGGAATATARRLLFLDHLVQSTEHGRQEA